MLALVLGFIVLLGLVLWRLLALERQTREQRRVIEELHRRLWQVEDLVALLHRDRESRHD
ncbi:MAG: hypothetical protein R2826_03940 [Thermoleophilia bacterium]